MLSPEGPTLLGPDTMHDATQRLPTDVADVDDPSATRPSAPLPAVRRLIDRRAFIRRATAGTIVSCFAGLGALADDALMREARAEKRSDGRERVPPGQRVITALKPMGGEEGDASRAGFRLKIHGEVDTPFTIDFRELLAMPQVEQALDVHCVTGWTVLGASLRGVRIADLAARAGVKATAKHVVFEAAHGYTANVRIDEALAPSVMIGHRLDGRPFAAAHGAPARAIVPDLYFWKSAKWITGIRFVAKDQPGYWEVRGYHNHADPWKEERFAG
jgi:DMSO/TMAO reductase YedYZ molybdopterin-dependent catalytic subunit